MEIRDVDPKSGNRWVLVAEWGSCGRYMWPVWVDWMVLSSASETTIGLVVGLISVRVV